MRQSVRDRDDFPPDMGLTRCGFLSSVDQPAPYSIEVSGRKTLIHPLGALKWCAKHKALSRQGQAEQSGAGSQLEVAILDAFTTLWLRHHCHSNRRHPTTINFSLSAEKPPSAASLPSTSHWGSPGEGHSELKVGLSERYTKQMPLLFQAYHPKWVQHLKRA